MDFWQLFAEIIVIKSNRTPARRLAGASFFHIPFKSTPLHPATA